MQNVFIHIETYYAKKLTRKYQIMKIKPVL